MIETIGSSSETSRHILHAVIGVWFRGNETFYVRRSERMENYPGAWSLFSIQYDPAELRNSLDLDAVQRLMEKMAKQRLDGAPIRVYRFLTASTCTQNPINKIVNLRLYRVELPAEPSLNPDYYIDADWMTWDEYEARRGNAVCGSCLRMWASFCSKRDAPVFRT